MEYLNRLGNAIHKEEEVLEDQDNDGRTRFRVIKYVDCNVK
jgi:hypothetical protein